MMQFLYNQTTVYASQRYSVPVPSQDKLGGLQQKGHFYLSLHHKVQKMASSNGGS